MGRQYGESQGLEEAVVTSSCPCNQRSDVNQLEGLISAYGSREYILVHPGEGTAELLTAAQARAPPMLADQK